MAAQITDLSQHRAGRARVRALDGIAHGRYENADDAAWALVAETAEQALELDLTAEGSSEMRDLANAAWRCAGQSSRQS